MTTPSPPNPLLLSAFARALFLPAGGSTLPALARPSAHVLLRRDPTEATKGNSLGAKDSQLRFFPAGESQRRSYHSLGGKIKVSRKKIGLLLTQKRSTASCSSPAPPFKSSVPRPSFFNGLRTRVSSPALYHPYLLSKRKNSSSPQPNPSSRTTSQPTSIIKELMRSREVYSANFKPPKHKVVLCHGLYGYGVKGKPGSQIHYWANVQDVLMECGVDLLVVEVPS